MPLKSFRRRLSRALGSVTAKKDVTETINSPMKPCLKPLDAYCLCMGALIRSVFWELPNEVGRNGNNIVFSMALAGAAAVVTVYTYSELAAHFPSTSFAYDYVYHFMGELPAFLVGWSIVLNITVRLICVSSYFGEVLQYSIFLENPAPANYSFMFVAFEEEWYVINTKDSPDYYTMGIVLLFTCLYFFHFKKRKTINTLFVVFGIVVMVVSLTILWLNVEWWRVRFHPFRDVEELRGFIYGSFLMYFCLIEVEVMLCIGGEVNNPTKNIPILLSSIIKHTISIYLLALFIFSACALTEGYHADVRLPVASILSSFQLPPKSILVVFGCFCLLFSTMYSRIFIITRTMYTMSKDGLIFKMFSFVGNHTGAPIVSTYIIVLFTLVITVFLKPTHLILRASRCGTLIVKIMMTLCVLICRYRCTDKRRRGLRKRWILINCNNAVKMPTLLTEYVSMKLILITILSCVILVLMCHLSFKETNNTFVSFIILLSSILAVCGFFALDRQPQNKFPLARQYLMGVPVVPFLIIMWDLGMLMMAGIPPLLVQLCWLALGLIHYFSYSYRNSKRRKYLSDRELSIPSTEETLGRNGSVTNVFSLGSELRTQSRVQFSK